MNELAKAYKILLFLIGVILVNITLFIFKSSNSGDSVFHGAFSLQKYILQNYNNFYVFASRSASNSSGGLEYRLFNGGDRNITGNKQDSKVSMTTADHYIINSYY